MKKTIGLAKPRF